MGGALRPILSTALRGILGMILVRRVFLFILRVSFRSWVPLVLPSCEPEGAYLQQEDGNGSQCDRHPEGQTELRGPRAEPGRMS